MGFLEYTRILRKAYVQLSYVLSLVLIAFVVWFFAKQGVSSHELRRESMGVLSLLWWISMGNLAIHTAFMLGTLGRDSDSKYVKEKYPDIWLKFFPGHFSFNNIPMIMFVLGVYGEQGDRRLAEVRTRWRIEFISAMLPFAITLCSFVVFFLKHLK